jgi:hypothetical protein
MLYLISALACFGLAVASTANQANYDPANTQVAWDNHLEAFVAQNTSRIMWDYSEESVIRTFEAGVEDDLVTASAIYSGLDQIAAFFDELFVSLDDTNGMTFQVEVVNGSTPSQVFLVWAAPNSGYLQATDTFIFDTDDVTIKYQNIVFTKNADLAQAPAPSRRLLSQDDYNPANVSVVWQNHFSAFVAQDIDSIMLDYDENSELRIFNFDEDTMTNDQTEFQTYTGLVAIEAFFVALFDQIWDIEKVSAPELVVTDDMVFLVWEAPELGFRWATDTFTFDGVTIRHQNIATAFTQISEPIPSTGVAEEPAEEPEEEPGIDAAGVVHRASIGAVAGLAIGYVFA